MREGAGVGRKVRGWGGLRGVGGGGGLGSGRIEESPE